MALVRAGSADSGDHLLGAVDEPGNSADQTHPRLERADVVRAALMFEPPSASLLSLARRGLFEDLYPNDMPHRNEFCFVSQPPASGSRRADRDLCWQHAGGILVGD